MESQRRLISFNIALAQLQGLLGAVVRVDVISDGLFFGIAFSSRLERIETPLPDNQAVTLHFADGETIDLDPSEMQVFVGTGNLDQTGGLELRLRSELVLELARVARDFPPDRGYPTPPCWH